MSSSMAKDNKGNIIKLYDQFTDEKVFERISVTPITSTLLLFEGYFIYFHS